MSEFNPVNNNELQGLMEAIKSIKDIDDEVLTEDVMNSILESIRNNFNSSVAEQAINEVIVNLEQQSLTNAEAGESLVALKEALNTMVYGEEEFTGNKKKIIDEIMENAFSLFDKVLEKYHKYAIELPMKLEEGAQVPSYAHETDAAADLYALEDATLNAHTYGNKIRTGVSIQLPEGWLALIIPRSSTGAKTTFRLSNSVGLIDSGYRGELGVLYDNTSDKDASIKKGERIAQLLVMPSYRFKAQVVDSLEDSDRGQGGFGSTGV